MRLRTTAVPVVLALCLVPAAARADYSPGWYFGMGGGWSSLDDLQSDKSALAFTGKTNNGYAVLGFGGYNFNGDFRLEGEFGYRRHSIKSLFFSNDAGLGAAIGRGSLTGTTNAAGGTIDAYSAMLNGIFNLLPHWGVSPYAGAGFGAAWLHLNKLATGGAVVADGSTLHPAFQGIAGLSAKMTDRVSLALDYRWFGTTQPGFRDVAGTGFRTTYHTQNVLLSLVFHFGPGEARSPQPVAAAPPPPSPPPPAFVPAVTPAPPPPVRNFLVFFDFDKAVLTPAGRQVVEAAAGTYKSTGSARIDLTGYTDLSGPVGYNLKLSRRRAEAVRDYLVQLGIPKDAITVTARGKQNPRVPTPDGVREPQNRRVEIVLP
jgi:OOP family OmpA-OmpF porin